MTMENQTNPGLTDDLEGDEPVQNVHSTPHQKELPAPLGQEKAEGMGKVRKIGLKKQKTDLYPK